MAQACALFQVGDVARAKLGSAEYQNMQVVSRQEQITNRSELQPANPAANFVRTGLNGIGKSEKESNLSVLTSESMSASEGPKAASFALEAYTSLRSGHFIAIRSSLDRCER